MKPVLAGVAMMAPILPGVVPFGMIAGIAALDAGMSPLAAQAMSVVVFAGAAQLAASQLLKGDSAIFVILLTMWIINLRFAMYSASLSPYLSHVGAGRRLPAAYMLSDQAYAMAVSRFMLGMPAAERYGFYMGAAGALWITWQVATFAGIVLGRGVPPSWSLDFAIPLTFLALLLPVVTDRPHVVAALTGAVVSVLAHPAPYNLGLLAGAASGIAAGVAAESAFARLGGGPPS